MLLRTRYLNKKAALEKKSKVAPTVEMAKIEQPKPVMEAIPEAIEEVSSMKEESLSIVGLPEPELLNPADEARSFNKSSTTPAATTMQVPVQQQPAEPQIIEEEFNAVSSIANPEEV